MRRIVTLGRLLAVAAVLSACSGTADRSDPTPQQSERTASSGGPESPSSDPALTGVRLALDRTLRARGKAVVDGDRRSFLRTATGPAQAAWFARMTRLPISELRYELGTADLSQVDATHYSVDVDQFTRLEGFDEAPVWTSHHVTFHREGRRWLVTEDRLDRSEILAAPWEFADLRIERSEHILLAVDASARRQAPELLSLFETAWTYVQSATPGEMVPTIVVAADDEVALRAEGMNTDELGRVGAAAAPVLAGPDLDHRELRVVVAPSSLGADPGYQQLMVRHELVHVALVDYGPSSPTWLTEGIAEYVAHQDLPMRLPNAAILDAREGIEGMPANGLFYRGANGDNSTNYAIAWWSLQYLALREGSDEPFALLEAFREDGESTRFEEMSALLEERYGLSADELAQRAGELIVRGWAGVEVPST